MLHNIAYVTPVLGAIRLGYIEERNGKRLPQKDDFFTITGLHKEHGAWVPDPLQEASLQKLPSTAESKLRAISVRVLYADPELNTSERYEAYDADKKRLVCAGDGKNAKRIEANGVISEIPCPGDAYCEFGRQHRCGIFGRALFQIDGQSDQMGAYIMRTASYNAVNTLRSKLSGLHALLGDRLPFVPLKLVMRTKSSPLSMNTAFYYADLELDGEIVDLAQQAEVERQRMLAAGIDRSAFESKMKTLRDNGPFEDPAESFDDREEFLGEREVVLQGEGSGLSSTVQEGVPSSGAKKVRATPFNRNTKPKQPLALSDIAALYTPPGQQLPDQPSFVHGPHSN